MLPAMTSNAFIPKPLEFERLAPDDMVARGRAFLRRMASRRSVREFSSEPVPRACIELAIATANTAPSGANRQPWHFVAVADPDTKRRIREAAEAEEREFYEGGRATPEWLAALAHLGTGWSKPHLEAAPWLVVVFKEVHGVAPDGDKVTNYYVSESVGIACGLLIAALHGMGLATLTHTPQPMRFLGEILGRPANERPYILFPVGYPAPGCLVPTLEKKAPEEVTTWVEPGTD
jgi:nitroreductase